MNDFKKEVAIFRDANGLPLLVLEVKTITSESEFLDIKRRAELNLKATQTKENQKRYEFEKSVNDNIRTLANAVDIFIKK